MRISTAVTVESPAAAAALALLVPHRVVPRLVLTVVALFADPPRLAPGPDAAARTFAAIGLCDPTTLATLPTGDAPAGLLRVTVRPPSATAAARAPDCPDHVAEWVAASAVEARRWGIVPAESAANDDAASVPRFASRLGLGKVVGDALSAAMRARGVRCGAVGCLVIVGVDDPEAALCTPVLVRRFQPAWVCLAGDAEVLHRDSVLGCNGNADVLDLSRLRRLQHLPFTEGGFCSQDKLCRIVLPRLSAAPFKPSSLFSLKNLQGLHVPWNWRAACLGNSAIGFGRSSLVHIDLSYQLSPGLVSTCFRGCENLRKLGWFAFADCKHFRILDVAECPKLFIETTDPFDACSALELIITSPHIDAATTSRRLETERRIKNVKVAHWSSEPEGGDRVVGPGDKVMPHVHRILDALDVLKPTLNTAERLPLPGVVPALPTDYTANDGGDLDDDDSESGREWPEAFAEATVGV